jgi:Cysteine-rich secretory protein family
MNVAASRPRFSRRGIVFVPPILMLLGLGGCLDSDPLAGRRPAYYADLATPGARLDPITTAEIINAYRANHGLSPLKWDPALVQLAEREAETLADKGEVREIPGSILNTALKARGFAPDRVLRSITGGYHSFADAFSGWRGARHHDGVLKMKDGQSFGLAAFARPNSRHRVYWVLLVAAR